LQARFFLAFAAVALLGVGAVGLVANQVTVRQFALYVGYGGQMRAQMWARLAAEYRALHGSWDGVEEVFGSSSPMQGAGQGRGRMMQGRASLGSERFLIVEPDGRVAFDSQGELEGKPLDEQALRHGAPIVVDGQTVGTLLATTDDLSGRSDLEQRFVSAVNQALLWAVLVVMVAALIAAALLARRFAAPLRRLTAAVEAMAQGDLSQRVEVRARDEVGELGQAVNRMAGDLQAARAQRQQMTADIAHELRNPLSVIRGNLDAILDGVYPTDVEHLVPVYEETMLLQRLVEDLRVLSLADAGQLRLLHADVDMGALLTGVADGVQAAAEERRISIRVEVPQEPLIVEGDADRLRQVIGNLMSNALRYTPEGGTIGLRGESDGNRVRILVSDTGKGIAEQDLPHVFDRFYRADPARDREAGGSGLGLAIARALVEAHGGTIEVQSTVGQGTVFTVCISVRDLAAHRNASAEPL